MSTLGFFQQLFQSCWSTTTTTGMHINASPNKCYNVACYMLQSRMRQNHIRLASHATYYKFLCSMLHATRMDMFINAACSMLHIFNVAFVWAHHATKS